MLNEVAPASHLKQGTASVFALSTPQSTSYSSVSKAPWLPDQTCCSLQALAQTSL